MISGICIPCTSIQQAALTVELVKISENITDLNSRIKMGKEAGIWYVVVMENLK